MVEKQFIYFWYKELGWKNDPFAVKHPEPVQEYISGYENEKKKINYAIIEKTPIILITGKEGSGKTTIALWLRDELKRYKHLVAVDYINRNVSFTNFLKNLIEPFMNIREKLALKGTSLSGKAEGLIKDEDFKQIFEAVYLHKNQLDPNTIERYIANRLKKKQLIILIDDFNKADENYLKLIEILTANNIEGLQLIISSSTAIPESINKNKTLKIELNGLKLEESKNMLIKRLNNAGVKSLEQFDDYDLTNIHKKSEGNPLKFLELIREKSIDIALSKTKQLKNNNPNKETKTIVDLDLSKEETEKESKPYEIKVISSAEERQYNIQPTIKKREEVKPKRIEKEERQVKRIR